MNAVTIHESGHGADKLQVISYGNGLAYAFNFGEAGAPMRTVFLQGEDATDMRDEFDAIEAHEPERLSRDIWDSLLDPYL